MTKAISSYVLMILLFFATDSKADTGSDFNRDWKFTLEAPAFASEKDFDDSGWRAVDLPHDWVIEGEKDPALAFAEATGRIRGKGIGWYRKHFTVEELDDRTFHIIFDGVYNNSTTWINGQLLGFHPYGYSPFTHDLTPFLVEGQNVIAVKVDHSAYADSRWYTGAGIYRNVRLLTTGKTYVPIWGIYVTTPEIREDNATVSVQIQLRNDFPDDRKLTLQTAIRGPRGEPVARQSIELLAGARSESTHEVHLSVDHPELWDIDSPQLYTLVTEVRSGRQILEQRETRFGIRSFRFDTNEGFFLNGRNLKIKGVNLHHDGGLVGAAVPKDVWRRRLETLREGGANAIRTAHNPPSEEFLELCDEMGFLVQDEFFDEWDYPKDKRFNLKEQSAHPETEGYVRYFHEYAERDLKNVMLRDRNHPSIIQWSIGNEIEWTYPRNEAATGFFDLEWQGNYFFSEPPLPPDEIKQRLETLPRHRYDIGDTARRLATWVREMDLTRPVTANLILPSASHLSGYTDALDVVGYSYRRVLYDYGHELYPDKPIMGTENLPQFHEWKAVMERDHISGTFLWTGIAYQGELRGEWPVNTSGSGLLDLAGFKTHSWHMYRSLWRDEPHLALATNLPQNIVVGDKPLYRVTESGEVKETTPGSWKQLLWSWHPMNSHWNYAEGETVIVEAYSNAQEVELFLNGTSFGSQQLADQADHIFKWSVPFERGEIRVRGTKGGEVFESSLKTHGAARSVSATVDQNRLPADAYSAAHIVVQLEDADGNPAMTDNRKITFSIPDGLKRLGVDNGSRTNTQKFQADSLVSESGRALLIVQSGETPGRYDIGIKAEGLPGTTVQIEVGSGADE